MARYMQTAASANSVVKELVELLPEEKREEGLAKIAKLFNLGIRVSPRAVHGTVRINAIQAAMRGLPIECRLQRVEGSYGRSFNALVTKSTLSGVEFKDEDESGDDE
jgi:hypothetical protein